MNISKNYQNLRGLSGTIVRLRENDSWKNEKKYLEILSFTYVHHKWRSYDKWFLKYKARCNRQNFLHFHLPDDLENQNFEKLKKIPGDITTLHMCTINDNHMMYDSWDMENDPHNFAILDHFLLFYPSNNSENQDFEKRKKYLNILSFYTSVP